MECSAVFEPAAGNSAEEIVATETLPDTPESNAAAPITTALVIGLIAMTGFYFWRKRSS
jgi:hypothetical protein